MRPLWVRGKAILLLAAAVLTGCGGYTAATGLKPEAEAEVFADGRHVQFVGVPIIGDHDSSRDLDFVLRVESVGKVLKIKVHEHSQLGNSALLVDLHKWINEIVDLETVMVAGKFKRGHKEQGLEYGTLELDRIAFLKEDFSFDQPYATNPSKTTYLSFSAAFTVLFAGFLFNK